IHGCIQLALGIGALLVWRTLDFGDLRWPLPIVAAGGLCGPVRARAATEVTALYLLIAARFQVNLNELFAGQGIQGYKGFLRLHIAADGSLTIYPIGVDAVRKNWRAVPTPPASPRWTDPRKPISYQLIEPPIRL